MLIINNVSETNNNVKISEEIESSISDSHKYVKSYQKNVVRKQYQNSKTEKLGNTKFNTSYEFKKLVLAETKENKVTLTKLIPNQIDQKAHPLNSTNTKKEIKPSKDIVVTKINKPTPKKARINITKELKELQKVIDQFSFETTREKKEVKSKIIDLAKLTNDLNKIGYWQTVHSIESKQGKLLYRPKNKARNCNFTSGPCGHHQLTVQALKDIGCNSMQCRKDRLDYNKSLKLSKKLLALNEKRLRKNGLTNLKDYEKYLIHQQGAYGIKNIIAATKGKKKLSSTIKKNMANNSPYSYKQYKKMGSKQAAKKFMKHWKHKWLDEKRLIIASIQKSNNGFIRTSAIPTFKDSDLNYALNFKF